MTAANRVGWCPGALRPMAAGDGLILRIKPRGGRLNLAQARGIADVARRHGNGALDLTQRANLQIRGLDERGLPPALGQLADLGLLDPTPEAEAVRNVVSSPLAGLTDADQAAAALSSSPHRIIPDKARSAAEPGSRSGLVVLDPGSPLRSVRDDRPEVTSNQADSGVAAGRAGVFDITACVAALEQRLARTSALYALPAKFCFVVDDGGGLGLRDVPADIRFEAFEGRDGPAFAVRLGGGEDAAGFCSPDDIGDMAEALARVFLDACDRDAEIRRMSSLVRRDGAEAILRRAGLDICVVPRPKASGPRDAVGPFGAAFGIGAPFGRFDVAQLDAIVAAARSELRLTPWRGILLPGTIDPREIAACIAAGLIADPADPRLGIAACVGAPDCHRATTPVLDHAARFAARLDATEKPIDLHVSGCSKGCAHGGHAHLTLVGKDGRYDVVIDGRPGDPPLRRGLDFAEALRCVRAAARLELQA